jgi:hypothetical protein
VFIEALTGDALLTGFEKDSDLWLYFPEFVKWNRQKIKQTCDWATDLLGRTPE